MGRDCRLAKSAERKGLITMNAIRKDKNKDEEDILDCEIEVRFVQLLRAAPEGKKADTIMSEVREMFPDVDDHRIRVAAGRAAQKLLKQHDL